MIKYNFVLQSAYDKKIKIKDQDFLCFSKKALKKYYNGKNYIVIGETKKQKPIKDANLFVIGNEQHVIKPIGTYKPFLNRKAGYACVGGDNYVAIIKSRVGFWLTFLALIAGIVVGGWLLLSMLTGSDVPTIAPNHPLPDIDSNVEHIENDNSGTPNKSEGGGAVSMIYSLNADVTLSNNNIGILFKNPQKSNHDVAIQLYITKDGQRTLIAESGRIPAGNMLRELTLISDNAVLSEGIYDGVFKVIYYNAQTGERAIVESDITDVKITVKN